MVKAPSITIRVYPDEEEAIIKGCRLTGMKQSDYVRLCIRSTTSRLVGENE